MVHGSLFHARGPAAAKDRSPSDDIVRGTATELYAADLRPGLTVAAADGVIRGPIHERRSHVRYVNITGCAVAPALC